MVRIGDICEEWGKGGFRGKGPIMKGLRCQTKEFTAYSIAASWSYCSKPEGFREAVTHQICILQDPGGCSYKGEEAPRETRGLSG